MEFQVVKENFIDKVNERAKGELAIKVRGGPEVIGSLDLGLAVQKGTIQISAIPTGFFADLVPGADAYRLSELTVEEERASGAYDYLKDLFAKHGFYYMGRQDPVDIPFFYTFPNVKIEKLEDFVGLKISGSPSFHAHIKGLGATPVVIPLPEYYTAMERHIVDIGTSSIYVWIDGGTYEVCKYIINHPYYRATPAMVVNLETWNRIPKHLQDMMMQTFSEHQKAWTAIDNAERAKALQVIQDGGVEVITFPPDVAEEYLRITYDNAWKEDAKIYPAEVVNTLKKLMTK